MSSQWMKFFILGAACIGLSACNGGDNKTNIELIQNMMDQISIKSQDWDPSQGDKLQMRTPPEHTVPREFVPYQYKTDIAGGWAQPNPYAGDMSAEFLTIGNKYYTTYCTPCHGATGAGDGPITQHKDMNGRPRNLINAEAKAYSDGRIYQAITAGYGVMGNYVTQITDAKKRWAVVNYVRSLQKQAQ